MMTPVVVHGAAEASPASKAKTELVAFDTSPFPWDGTPPDDFEVLPGIGEIYERRLYEAGICTYEALAATSPEQLTDICKAPPMRTPDYAAWIAMATDLAAARRSG